MHSELTFHFNQVLVQYTGGEHYDTFLAAKKRYFLLTGVVDADGEDYEARMNIFNDWYLFNFVARDKIRTAVADYIVKSRVKAEIASGLLNPNFSLFEYCGGNFRGKEVLKDLLHQKTIILGAGQGKLSLVKGDIFIGRVGQYREQFYAFNGMRTLPTPVKPLLEKRLNEVARLNSRSQEESLLLHLEYLKTRLDHYSHLDLKQIFTLEHL
jgi:hypothetical protein